MKKRKVRVLVELPEKAMTVEKAFLTGLSLVREAGLPAKGSDTAVLAAFAVFEKACSGKEHDPRFAAEAPLYAKRLILLAYAA